MDQATICDWIKKTSNVELASFVSEADKNIKHSPFKPKAAQPVSNSGNSTTPSESTTDPNPGAAPQNSGGSNGTAMPALANAS